MLRIERIDSLQDSLLAAFQGLQSGLWTALPGIVTNVSRLGSEQTVDVQPSVLMQLMGTDETWFDVSPPVCIHCPAQFPSGGGVTLTFPVAVGDECLLVFASRCIDGWWQQGGVAKQAEYRMHDLSDGFALLGFRSKPHVLSALSTTEAELRSDDGSTVIGLNPITSTLTLKATNIVIQGNVALTGNLGVSGSLANDGVDIGKTHKHSGVQSGSNNTGNPI